ncbi:MAG: vWA domain-containing protein [Planctomycetota bacterium]
MEIDSSPERPDTLLPSRKPAAEAVGTVEVVRTHPVPAWLLSCGLHTLLLVLLALLYQATFSGAAQEQTRTGGIVLVAADTETTEYLSEGDRSDSSASSESAAQSPPPLPSEAERLPDLPGLASSESPLTGVGDDLLEALPGANSLTEGTTQGREVGGQVTTEIFGVKGTGNRFVYVFDKSDSMNGFEGRPLRAAKEAMLTSVESLGEINQFQIVFYNNERDVFKRGNDAGMFFGTPEVKLAARRFFQGVIASGGTDHLQALRHALSLQPDVVFLLTDAEGGFTSDELRQIAGWNRSGAVINAIEFGQGAQNDGDRSLEALVRQHRGQYVYKNILTLKK